MLLLAPVSNIQSAKMYLDAGADGIYLGASSPYLRNYSFNGRAKVPHEGKCILPDSTELKNIINITHDNGDFL